MKLKTVGQRVRHFRIDVLGASQGRLAKLARTSRQTISGLERDAIKHPKAETLRGVAKALGVTVDYLLTGRSR